MKDGNGDAAFSQSSLNRPRALLLAVGGALALPAAGMAQSTYAPVQIRNAYGFNTLPATVNGNGQTIAIIDFGDDPTVASDLTQFDSEFHFTAPATFSVVNETGGATLPAAGDTNAMTETSLDVQYVHAIAPAASIVLVEAPLISTVTQTDLNNAEDTAAKAASVVSMSFGFPGGTSGETVNDTHFIHPGVTFVASSGDTGVWNYPASSPNVIGVGGTSLTINGGVNNGFINATGGTYGGETTWNDAEGSGGGGVDPQEPIPPYQISIAPGLNRNVPDVSYDADPETGVDFVLQGNTFGFEGGTSAGAPQWAGLIALADQLRVGHGLLPLSSAGALTMMYAAYSDPVLYAELFHDITTGSNTNGDFAAVGYDDVTGLGTPIANNLVYYLADLPLSVPEPTGALLSAMIAVPVLLGRRRRLRAEEI